MKYRKKPVVIEADVFQWGMEDGVNVIGEAAPHKDKFDYLEPYIATLEGDMVIRKGDYIITGIKGERCPCKPDIFEQSYELAEGEKKC